jgi:hypothetical protein
LDENVDILINPLDTNFSNLQGASQIILNNAGTEIQDEVN